MMSQAIWRTPRQQADQRAKTAGDQRKREYERLQLSSAVMVRHAPGHFAQRGLAEPEIDQRGDEGEQSVETDEAVTFGSEQSVIDDVEQQWEDQSRPGAGEIGEHVQQLTFAHCALEATAEGPREFWRAEYPLVASMAVILARMAIGRRQRCNDFFRVAAEVTKFRSPKLTAVARPAPAFNCGYRMRYFPVPGGSRERPQPESDDLYRYAVPGLFAFIAVISAALKPLPQAREWLLIGFSVFIIASWGIFDAVLFLAIAVANFFAAGAVARLTGAARRGLLIATIACDIGALALFKYYNFIGGNFSAATGWPAPQLALGIPLAISFYTFHVISYLVDVHRKVVPQASFRHYLFYLSFFPHVVAGPIVRAWQLVPQLLATRRVRTDLAIGVHFLVTGLFLKSVLADNIGGGSTRFGGPERT